MAIKFRYINDTEVECRVAQVTAKGVSLLLYKDARCDMNILDETVGPMNWKRSHEFKDGRLYCTVSIWDDEKGQWISKEDVGVESNAEPEKGQSSDSFKRACVNWGIGRELYSSPFIWVPEQFVNILNDRGKLKTKDKFVVRKMTVNDGKITDLIIFNQTKNVCAFSLLNNAQKTQTSASQNNGKSEQLTPGGLSTKQLKYIFAKANESGIDTDGLKKGIKKYFGKDSINDITKAEMDILLEKFKKAS